MSTDDPQVACPWFTVGADRIRLLRDGAETFPAMLHAIARAEREVLLEFYWITPDKAGRAFREALAAAAARGVEVRVLYDSIGSRGTTRGWWRALFDAGGDAREYHGFAPFEESFTLGRMMQRDHRKLMVVDGRVGFMGGVNLGDCWLPIEEGGSGWRDDAIQAEGPVAGEIRSLFYRTWRRVTRTPPPPDVRPLARRQGEAVFVLASQRRRRRNIHREYLVRIRASRRSVDLAHAYFIPDCAVRHALYRAVERGVRVRVLLPRTSDVVGLQFATDAFYDSFLRRGVEVYEYPPPMLHSKTAIVDERFVTVGSYNLDERSWRKNLEANLGVLDVPFAKYVTAQFERDLARAKRIDPLEWSRRSISARRGAELLALALREIW